MSTFFGYFNQTHQFRVNHNGRTTMGEPQWGMGKPRCIEGTSGGGGLSTQARGLRRFNRMHPANSCDGCLHLWNARFSISFFEELFYRITSGGGGGKVLEKKNQVKMKRKQSFARSIKSLVVGRNLSMKLHAVWAHFPIAWQQAMTSVHYLATNITGWKSPPRCLRKNKHRVKTMALEQ